jgi:hypothetical protein
MAGGDVLPMAKLLVKGFAGAKNGTGSIPQGEAQAVTLPIASDNERAQLGHQVWTSIQRQGFKLTRRTIPISKIIATQDEVSKQRVEAEKQHLAESDNSFKWPPILFEMDGLWYMLDGHHRTEAAKAEGLKHLIVDSLEPSPSEDTLELEVYEPSEIEAHLASAVEAIQPTTTTTATA